ncbi:hypothetical protein BLA29_008354 [Euroglyphus maynei]|uniref:Uncharacterized protein n=1 Tax=Euroglyphus maynei TaxID=6958 RepID=A0A1Y3BL65_EURMA|nr:hypothetical protein BLA29_008354 [Euroglyphus maynei]
MQHAEYGRPKPSPYVQHHHQSNGPNGQSSSLPLPPEPAELIDRKTYKATSPTCHDFCTYIEPPISLLLIGFSLGQIQMVDFYRSEISKFYNQEV